MSEKLTDCLYVTNEQAIRLVAISADALCGMQIRGNASSDSGIVVDSVDYDQRERHFYIAANGEIQDIT